MGSNVVDEQTCYFCAASFEHYFTANSCLVHWMVSEVFTQKIWHPASGIRHNKRDHGSSFIKSLFVQKCGSDTCHCNDSRQSLSSWICSVVSVITARQWSCGKVIFSDMSVCLSAQLGMGVVRFDPVSDALVSHRSHGPRICSYLFTRGHPHPAHPRHVQSRHWLESRWLAFDWKAFFFKFYKIMVNW